MHWLIFSVLNAVFNSIGAALGKKETKRIDVFTIAWAQNFFARFILFPLGLISHSFVPVNQAFLLAVFASSLANTFLSILFFRALKESPISLVLPIVSLTPVFLLITSPLIVGEFPKPLGVVGIITTVIGSYAINLSKRVHSPFEPLLSIVKEKGTRLMLIVAFAWSVTSNIDKIGVNNANPIMYAFSLMFMLAFFLTIILLVKKKSFVGIFKKSAILAPMGFAFGLSVAFQMIAISMTIVPNVIALKRTSALLGVFWGKIFFKEENIKERLVGTVIMLLGVVLIVLS